MTFSTLARQAQPHIGRLSLRRMTRLAPLARTLLLGSAPPIGLALVWEFGVRAGWIEARLMPAPSHVLALAGTMLGSGELTRHVLATLGRVLAGFGIGAAVATVLGVAAGLHRTTRELIDPLVQALRAIPSIAWVPLFILWFGIFETSKVVLIALGAFFPVYLGVMDAVAGVDRKLVEVGRMFRLSRMALVRRVMLPSVLPAYVVALRTGFGLAFMFVVAAEIMGASEGLGYLLVDGQQLGRPDEILVSLLVFALVGKACDAVLVAIARPLLAWRDVDRRDIDRRAF